MTCCKECVLVNKANSFCGSSFSDAPCISFSRQVPEVPCCLPRPPQPSKLGPLWDITGSKEGNLPLGEGTGTWSLWSEPGCESSALFPQPGTPHYLPLDQLSSKQCFDTQPSWEHFSLALVCLRAALGVNTSLAEAGQDQRQRAQQGFCSHYSFRLERSQGSSG